MKTNKPTRFLWMILVLVLAALACSGGGEPPVAPATQQPVTTNTTETESAGLSQAERNRLISATVQIYALFEKNGELTPVWTGSGTILSPYGMILTNAHVASPSTQTGEADPDALGIAIIESEDKPAVPAYLAEVRAADGYLDLAVIQIVSTVDGTSVDPNSLNLPYVEIGDSQQVHVGDPINIFGFPGIGGDTITYTKGSVSGFTSEDQIGDRAWIKTDATIAGGNSGGLGADDSARIVGIPTIASSGAGGNVTDCRQIQDTNGDGSVDQNDSCIPIGGFINALRPIELAKQLIDTALAGQDYASPFSFGSSGSNGFEPSGDTATLYGVVFDSATNNPINNVSVFVLSPGVTYDQWAAANYSDEYIVASLQTGDDGAYRITDIPRNTEFTIVFSVEGYYDKYGDNMTISDSEPAEVEMNVGMNQ